MYYLPEPPYFLIVVGLFAGMTSGIAFEATLKQKVGEWSKNRSTRTLAEMKGSQLQLPFLGMVGGVAIFLSAGLEVFGFPSWLSYVISIPLTIFIGLLIWWQLRNVLGQLERGGSKALDLDMFT
ncbi:MAG: hypothetical protein WBB28_25630 [Crinalium sp.]|uniref:Uncharacterized protein n=1 Tax=Crinalium epipsammum PCC 9333 TaxID=1173022 RepID=K9VW40_9CYAN|nr:hypothetical protein [Crinalium epipsammum]AFZ12323.1 hypothetical protein Cri9333_1429 [Crinalium epipsammum PCC 9333]